MLTDQRLVCRDRSRVLGTDANAIFGALFQKRIRNYENKIRNKLNIYLK